MNMIDTLINFWNNYYYLILPVIAGGFVLRSFFKTLIKYSETLSKYSSVILPFIISGIMSTGIVIFSSYYAKEEFTPAWLGVVFMIIIEIALISLRYIAASNPYIEKKDYKKSKSKDKETGFWKTKILPWFIDLDRFIIALLFCLSVTPAALQVSSHFIDKDNQKIVVEPIKPVKSELSKEYTKWIEEAENSIKENAKSIEKIRKEISEEDLKFLSYRTKEYRDKIDDLNIKKSGYVEKKVKLDEAYETDLKQYNLDLEAYKKDTKKSLIASIADFVALLYSFILAIIVQMANVRVAFHGSSNLRKILEDNRKTNKNSTGKKQKTPKQQKEVLYPLDNSTVNLPEVKEEEAEIKEVPIEPIVQQKSRIISSSPDTTVTSTSEKPLDINVKPPERNRETRTTDTLASSFNKENIVNTKEEAEEVSKKLQQKRKAIPQS